MRDYLLMSAYLIMHFKITYFLIMHNYYYEPAERRREAGEAAAL